MAKEYPIAAIAWRASRRPSPATARHKKVYATYTQEQVDKIFKAAAIAANKQRIPLAKMAVEETGMGVVEDKVIKNHYAAEYIYNTYKDTKTCGVIEDDAAMRHSRRSPSPWASWPPSSRPPTPPPPPSSRCLTGPEDPQRHHHLPPSRVPRSAPSRPLSVVLDAAVAAGAPEGIIAWIDVPSLELTNELMQDADIILATGGPGMVKAAYSSGKPALGVGAGNTPAIIDDTADVKLAVNSIIHSKTFDNGMICASEQSVIVLDSVYDAGQGRVRRPRLLFPQRRRDWTRCARPSSSTAPLNAKIVGQKRPHHRQACRRRGARRPPRSSIGEVESVDLSEEFAHEKLSPVLAMYRAKDLRRGASTRRSSLVADGGYGHTSSIYLNVVTQKEKIRRTSPRA